MLDSFRRMLLWIGSRNRLGGALALLGPLALYMGSAARDLGSIDSGELAAVCATLGIAHPTGYPLYTLLGRLAVLLPGGSPILRLNLGSSLLASISCFFAFLLFRSIITRVRPTASARSSELLALGGAWLWAAHPALWSQAIGNEVHALQAVLVTLLLCLASLRRTQRDLRFVLLTAYVLGLAFTNHMTALYLLPALAAGALVESSGRGLMRRPRLLAILILAVLTPLTLYLYLPIRGHAAPLLNWGEATNAERFLRHVGAKQYRVWMFASSAAFGTNLWGFMREWLSPWGLIPLVSGIAGAAVLLRRDPAGGARLGLGLVVGALWASGYEIHDLEPYYLVPRLCLAGLAIAGASLALPVSGSPRWRWLVIALPLAAAILLAGLRWDGQTRRNDRFVRLYAESVLERLPERAILISRHWDMVVSPLLYIQAVEHRRPDVTVVDVELLRRSWYFPQLRRTDPTLLVPIEDRITPFLEDLRLFERDEPYDPRRIEERYRAVIAGIFEAHRLQRPVFHTPDVEPTFYGGWTGIPEALAIRMVPDARTAPPSAPLRPEDWSAQSRYVREDVRRQGWRIALELARRRIDFLDSFGRTEEAQIWRGSLARLEAIRLPEEER